MATATTIHVEAGLETAMMCSLLPRVDAVKIPIRRQLNGDFTFGVPVMELRLVMDCVVGVMFATTSPTSEVERRSVWMFCLFKLWGAMLVTIVGLMGGSLSSFGFLFEVCDTFNPRFMRRAG